MYVDQEEPSIAPAPVQEDTGVSLSNPVQTPYTLPDDVAQTRAIKIQEGVGEHVQKDATEIKADIQEGREDTLRNMAASNLRVKQQSDKLQLITKLANSQGSPLNENEVARLTDPFNPLNQPIDPNSVVEKQYATKYIQSIQEAINVSQAQPLQEAPQEMADAQAKGTDLTARMEFARKLRENWEATIGGQSWPAYLTDTAKTMFQPYVEYKMRGNTPGVGTVSGGVLLGENIQEQADKIFGLPFDEFTKQAKAITDQLGNDNPQLAAKFAAYIEGLPASDRILDNTFTVMALPDYAAMGKLGGKAVKAVNVNRQANQAVRQLVEHAEAIQTDRAARSEATGDLASASTQRASDNVEADINGKSDPIKLATDPLTTNLAMDRDKLAIDKGNLSTEGLRRIQD